MAIMTPAVSTICEGRDYANFQDMDANSDGEVSFAEL